MIGRPNAPTPRFVLSPKVPYTKSRLEVVTNKNKVVAYEAIEKEKLIVKCSEPTKGNCLRKSKSLSLPPAMIQLMR